MSQPATDPTGVVQPAPIPGVAATPPGFVVFQLTDAEGTPHRYEVQPHPATEGANVMFALMALGAEPFASVVSSALAAEDVLGGAKLDDLLDTDLEHIAGAVDWGKVGADVKRSILSMPLSTLARDVLRYTWRDGKALSNDVFYNAAFSRNYFEMLRAVWEVASANRFLPRFDTSGKGDAPRTPPA